MTTDILQGLLRSRGFTFWLVTVYWKKAWQRQAHSGCDMACTAYLLLNFPSHELGARNATILLFQSAGSGGKALAFASSERLICRPSPTSAIHFLKCSKEIQANGCRACKEHANEIPPPALCDSCKGSLISMSKLPSLSDAPSTSETCKPSFVHLFMSDTCVHPGACILPFVQSISSLRATLGDDTSVGGYVGSIWFLIDKVVAVRMGLKAVQGVAACCCSFLSPLEVQLRYSCLKAMRANSKSHSKFLQE